MKVEVRFYSQYDPDLVGLAQAGYDITEMTKNAVISFAHGRPLQYVIPTPAPFNPNNKRTIHTAFVVPSNDARTITMLKGVTYRLRNSYCKMILRNCLMQQNITAFFLDQSVCNYANNIDMGAKNKPDLPGRMFAPTYDIEKRQKRAEKLRGHAKQEKKTRKDYQGKSNTPQVSPEIPVSQQILSSPAPAPVPVQGTDNQQIMMQMMQQMMQQMMGQMQPAGQPQMPFQIPPVMQGQGCQQNPAMQQMPYTQNPVSGTPATPDWNGLGQVPSFTPVRQEPEPAPAPSPVPAPSQNPFAGLQTPGVVSGNMDMSDDDEPVDPMGQDELLDLFDNL